MKNHNPALQRPLGVLGKQGKQTANRQMEGPSLNTNSSSAYHEAGRQALCWILGTH